MMENNICDNLLELAFSEPKKFNERVDKIVSTTLESLDKDFVLRKLLSLLDITTLHDDDYKQAIEDIALQSTFEIEGNSGVVAGICVYSNLLPLLNAANIDKRISKVVVSGGFPTGQMSLEGKLHDIGFAIENKADEIDVPINRGLFFENVEELCIELNAMNSIVKQNPKSKLKVIIEAGELKDFKNVYTASKLAMTCGADFIKTSTGKVSRGADIYSSAVMMLAIKEFMDSNLNRTIGFKAAGGIRTSVQAMQYYALMTYFFGEEYITKDTFRIGCSNLKQEIINNI